MFKSFWGSQEQQAQPRAQEVSTDSWYPPSVVSSPGSSRPATPTVTSSGSFGARATDRSHSLSHVSPAEAAGIISSLKDKSVDELRKLLSDKDAYQNFLLSLEPVKTQNKVRDDLRNETLQLTKAMNVTDDESEALHRQLLDREIDLPSFVQKYKKLRYTYHKRALTHLAAKTSVNA